MKNCKQRSDMGFFVPEVCREYLPVKLFVRIEHEVVGYHPFADPENVILKPSEEYTEMLCFVGRNYDGDRAFYVKIEGEDYAREVMNPEHVRIQFDSDVFCKLMYQASRKNKILFFHLAELPSKFEMDRFLEKIKNSFLSPKDKKRATTWVLQMASRQLII